MSYKEILGYITNYLDIPGKPDPIDMKNVYSSSKRYLPHILNLHINSQHKFDSKDNLFKISK